LKSISAKVLVVYVMCLAGCSADRAWMAPDGQNPFFPGGNLVQSDEQDENGTSYWDGDGISGRPRIEIDLINQRAYFYKGGELVAVSLVSTGREGHDTLPGNFQVVEKDIDHASSIYGDYVDQTGRVVVQNVKNKKDPRPPGTIFRGAPMPYFLRIRGDIGMHAGYLPGYPASHGCIRLPEQMAVKFFQNAPVGTPVEIR
jgi:lipoprotein-anchoring transpeptidase ErfK/SrfK